MTKQAQYEIVASDLVTWEQLKKAATRRISAAQQTMSNQATPQVCVYLVHVALECALKARIVRKSGCRSPREIRDTGKIPEADFNRLFKGTDGHRISELANYSNLKRLLAAADATLNAPTWQRICHPQRPYSARYGSEDPSVAIAAAELEVGIHIVGIVNEDLQ